MLEDTFILVFLLDLTILILCTVVLLRSARLTFSHPGTIYLFFHVISITLRGWLILNGSPRLFADRISWSLRWEPVTYDEITRAILVSDLALVAVAVACLVASHKDKVAQSSFKYRPPHKVIELEGKRIWSVSIIVFIVGTIGILIGSELPSVSIERLDLGEWTASTWITMLQMWPITVLLILIYRYGFRWPLVLLLALNLLVMLYQGYHRFRVVIPLLMLAQYYIEKRGLKWPPKRMTMFLVAVGIAWFPMKAIGQMLQQGASVETIFDRSAQMISNTWSDSFSDLSFLDQLASALTLADRRGEFYYGRTYLAIVSLPIPRPWWPDKPPLNFHTHEISTPSRPMGTLGMIVTLAGESYINFGYLGVGVVPFLLLYLLTRFYFTAKRRGLFTITRAFYLLMAAGLIQVYRDGIPSIVLFTVVNFMPITLIFGLHILFPPKNMPNHSVSRDETQMNRSTANKSHSLEHTILTSGK